MPEVSLREVHRQDLVGRRVQIPETRPQVTIRARDGAAIRVEPELIPVDSVDVKLVGQRS